MKIVTVLRQSTEYTTQHARWLHKQLKQYDSLCLTDATHIAGVDIAPLLYDWPAWFSKIELFNPEHPVIGKENLLFIDLDSVITGDLSPFLVDRSFTTLTDFYHEESLLKPMASAVMFIPNDIKPLLWGKFMQCPEKHITCNTKMPFHGDQGFIGKHVDPMRWQDVLPGMIVSYKKDIACEHMVGFHRLRSIGNGTPPPEARIVCFHGYPRPWNIEVTWAPSFPLVEDMISDLNNMS